MGAKASVGSVSVGRCEMRKSERGCEVSSLRVDGKLGRVRRKVRSREMESELAFATGGSMRKGNVS